MKRNIIAIAAFAAFLTLTAVAQKPTPEAQLGAIINLAEGQGNYEAAIPAYEKFLKDNARNRTLAARALYHLGLAQEKLGKPDARRTYEQIVREYPNEPAAADARKRQVALSGGAPAPGVLTARLISDLAGQATSISADGRFMTLQDGRLTIRNMATGEVVRPAAAQRVVGREAELEAGGDGLLSPDGRQVAYSWAIVPKGESVYSRFQMGIFRNHTDTEPRILIDSTEYRYPRAAAWAPDGKSILMTFVRQDNTWQIAWVSTADGKVTPLKSLGWRAPSGSSLAVSVSPDGKYVTYAAKAGNPGRDGGAPDDPTRVYVLAADGSTPETEVVGGSSLNESPVWMPDGKSLLFSSKRTGNFGIYSVAVQEGRATADPILIQANTGRIATIGITQSGSYYYRTFPLNVHKVLVADLDGTKPGGAATGSLIGYNAAWSTDGKRIAFIRSSQSATGPGRATQPDSLVVNSVVVHSVDSGDEKRYTMKSLEEGPPLPPQFGDWPDPIWLPDGKSLLVFTQDSRGRSSVYRLDLGTGEFKLVLSALAINRARIAISFDGKTMYVAEGMSQPVGMRSSSPGEGAITSTYRILAFDLASGVQRTLTSVSRVNNENFQIDLSPNGQTMYLTATRGTTAATITQMIAIDLSTGQQRPLLNTAASWGAFSPDRTTHYSVTCNPRCNGIVAMDLRTGNRKELLIVREPETIERLTLSEDGSALAFMVRRQGESNQMARIGVDGGGYRKLNFSVALTTGRRPPTETLRWAHNGNAVFVSGSDNSLIRVPAGDGTPEVAVPPAANLTGPADWTFSPDGLRVALRFVEAVPVRVWALDNVAAHLKSKR